MDVPCPKCNNTGLQKVSLACEEVLYLCDNAHSSFKSTPRRPLLEVCWSHARKIVRRGELFGPNHEIK